MASDNETGGMLPDHGQNSLTIGLSLLTGAGVTLMVIAAAIGVVDGPAADSEVISVMFWLGAAAFISGAVAWGGVVRPWENFDDINQPLADDHHGHDDHDEDESADLLEAGITPALPETTAH